MNTSGETRTCIEFPGYRVSRHGEVWNLKGTAYMKKCMDKRGRRAVTICGSSNRRQVTIMRLIGLCWVKRPDDFGDGSGYHADHIDDDCTNDCVENFQWLSVGDNNRKMAIVRNGVKGATKRSKPIKLTQPNGDVTIFKSWREAARAGFQVKPRRDGSIRDCKGRKVEYMYESMLPGEIWKTMPGKPGSSIPVTAQVSNMGRVKSSQMKPSFGWLGHNGYRRTSICRGKTLSSGVHVLVCQAFNGGWEEGLDCCHYPDDNPQNNKSGNLMFATRSANNRHKTNAAALMKEVTSVHLATGDIRKFNSRTEAGQALGVQSKNISKVLKGTRKHTGGYFFHN
jgi:hypothetical protein